MKKIDLYRLWKKRGFFQQAIASGDISIHTNLHMAYIDFYEAEKAKGNKHPVKATLSKFVIDEATFYYAKQQMYKTVNIDKSNNLS